MIPSKSTFSKGELELLDYLWERNEPLSPWEVEEQWEENTWTASHIRHLLTSLEEKGAVECCGAQRRGRQYSRRFRCTISQEEYYTEMAMSKGITAEKFLRAEAAALVKKGSREDMEALVEELEGVIKEFKERIESGE